MKNTLIYNQLVNKELIKGQTITQMFKVKPGGHYKQFAGHINFLPSSKAQAIYHTKKLEGTNNNLLMCGEWHHIEELLNKHNFIGYYTLTKSQTMCRLVNTKDLAKAIKLEFNIN